MTLQRCLAAVLVICLLAATSARCELATSAEMDQVCQNWLAQMVYERGTWGGVQNPHILSSHNIMSGDTLLARSYDIYPSGYVLISALKEMSAVKAYSEECMPEYNAEDGFLTMVTESYSRLYHIYANKFGSLAASQPATGDAVFGRGNRAEWTRLTASSQEFDQQMRSARRLPMSEAGPLLTSKWSQGSPYNNLCPMGSGGRTVVGCVATAAAQIMKFWQWPPNGVGSHSYTWNGDQSCGGSYGGGVLSADFTDTYDWANIPDSCTDGCTSEQTSALAHLNYEVGVAFNMDYGKCGSGASVARAVTVFPSFFKYSSDIRKEDRINYDLPGWFGVIKEEIDNGRPGDYRISQHSIVCDGYRNEGSRYEFHMNYGWGGRFTTWFALDSLYCYWEADSLCPAAEEFMITHIQPQTKPILSLVGRTLGDQAGNKDGRPEAGETITLNATIINRGLDASSVVGTLTTSDPYVTITTDTSSMGNPKWGEQAASATPFVFKVGSTCPDPHIALLVLTMSEPGGNTYVDTIQVFVGNRSGMKQDAESGQGYWTHEIVTPQYLDEWHLDTYRQHGGTTSWKAGGTGAANYSDLSDGGLVSPPFLLPANGRLTFWHWIAAEINNSATAWDGAMVMISTGDGNWTEITPTSGYEYTIVSNPDCSLPGGTPVFSGSQDWTKAEYDLSAYSGVVQLMFRFAADGATNYEGWYVDDIEVPGCCVGTTGNVNQLGIVDLSDLSALVSYLTGGGYVLTCIDAANVNGTGIVDLSDLSALVSYLTGGGFNLPTCP